MLSQSEQFVAVGLFDTLDRVIQLEKHKMVETMSIAMTKAFPFGVKSTVTPSMSSGHRSREELLELVCALSGACRANANVLKDNRLVDILESQAKEILRVRQMNQNAMSPPRAKMVKKQPNCTPVNNLKTAGSDSMADTNGMVMMKRRKLSTDGGDHLRSPSRYAMPSPYDKENNDPNEGHGPYEQKLPRKSSVPDIRQFSSKLNNPGMLNSKNVGIKSSKYANGETSGPSPTKTLNGSRVDLSASIASTQSSNSMAYYDDMFSNASLSRVPTFENLLEGSPRQSPVDMTQSLGSIDWTPVDDAESSDGGERHGTDFADSLNSALQFTRSFNRDDPVTKGSLNLKELSQDQANEPSKVMESTQGVKNSTEAVMQVLYRLMQHDRSLTWLLDPVTQARVAKLVEYEKNKQACNDDSQQSALLADELRAQLDDLVHESSKIQSENEKMKQINDNIEVSNTTAVRELEEKLVETQEKVQTQEKIRHEAEGIFQSELDAKARSLESLQRELHEKDEEISTLMKRVEDVSSLFASKMRESEARSFLSNQRRMSLDPRQMRLSGDVVSFSSTSDPESQITPKSMAENIEVNLIASLRESNHVRAMEVKKMRTAMMEKDREICNLYMQLSTKQLLVDEITKSLKEQVKLAKTGLSESNPMDIGFTDNIHLDLDMFLFKNVVDKQSRINELNGALGYMEREVESLENRLESTEKVNEQLKSNCKNLSDNVQTTNDQVCRLQGDNQRLVDLLKDKQSKIRDLIEFLEDKEKQVLQLEEQVEMRQTQLDMVLTNLSPAEQKMMPKGLIEGNMDMGQLNFSEEMAHHDRRSSCLSAALDEYSNVYSQDEMNDDSLSNRASYCSSEMNDELDFLSV